MSETSSDATICEHASVGVEEIADQIDDGLRAVAVPERAEKERSYLKSDLVHYGVSVPDIRRVAKSALRDHGPVDHDDLVALVETLWAEPVHERRMACVELLDAGGAVLGPDDMALLERLIREARTWAIVDGLAASVAGSLVDREPTAAAVLDRWAVDHDFWIRRSALLALLVPLRRGAGDFDRFGRYADQMLDETEFFVRKAIGWVLRDTGRKRPDLTYGWLLPRAHRASGVTTREALKPLSEQQRSAILAAR